MADTAAWLVERVHLGAAVHQRVLTLPPALLYRLAFDAELIAVVLAEFMRAVFSPLHLRARHGSGIAKPRCGAVTFVQHSGDAPNSVNQRYHSWAELMRRVFAFDLLECPRCQGSMESMRRSTHRIPRAGFHSVSLRQSDQQADQSQAVRAANQRELLRRCHASQ